ncbi:MAG: exo-alpha-sialidase [Sphingobacteriaceae bacterium]|nr:MAG: exo-alpha-sialidase [Sphingobacteriaceae bacterium]
MNRFLTLSLCCILCACAKERPAKPTKSATAITENTATTLEAPFLRVNSSEALEGTVLLKQDTSKFFNDRFWQGIPTVTSSKGGILYAAWYSGANGEGVGNFVTVSVSTDQGITWKNNELIINPDSNLRFFDPVLWTDKYNHVILFFNKARGRIWDGKGGVWAMSLMYNAATDSIAYTQAMRLSNGVMQNKPVDTNDGSSTLFPIALWKFTGFASGVYLYQSVYNEALKRADQFFQMSVVPFAESERTYDEHQVIQLKDGYYVMLRGRYGLYYMRKGYNDIGWGPTKKFLDMTNTSSRFTLWRLKSGRIALIINNSLYTRENLTIYLSSDEMKTWSYGMLIDVRKKVTYPDMVQTPDGRINVIYDHERFIDKNIQFVSFTEKDVIQNKPENITRVLISGNALMQNLKK